MSRYAPFVRFFLVIFILGIALAGVLNKKFVVLAIGCLVASFFFFIYVFLFEGKVGFLKLNKSKQYILLIILGLCFAFGRVSLEKSIPLLPSNFQGTVVYDSVPTAYGSMVVVISKSLEKQTKVYTSRYPEYQSGDIVSINITKNELDKKYIVGDLKLISKNNSKDFRNYLLTIKRKFIQNLSNIMPEPEATFTAGTVVGGSASLPENIRDSFRISGISHILAASGYNFTLLLIFLGFLLRKLSLKKSLLISFLIIPCFAIIAGASPSVLRAATMGALANFAILSGRISSIKTVLLWTAVIMLIIDPSLLNYDLGFQLSFLATMGLVFVVPIFEKIFQKENIPIKSWKELIFATISAQITTAPLIAYIFGTISLIAIPVNLIVVPAIPFIMIISIISSILFFIWPVLASIVAFPAWFLSNYIIKVSQFFANLDWAQILFKLPKFSMFSIYLVLFVVIYYFHNRLLKHRHGL